MFKMKSVLLLVLINVCSTIHTTKFSRVSGECFGVFQTFVNVKSLLQCVSRCMISGNCTSMSYMKVSGVCEQISASLNGICNSTAYVIFDSNRSICEPGWIHLGNNCYFISLTIGKLWLEAKNYCNDNESSLAVIETSEENQELKGHLLSLQVSGVDFYIGGNDLEVEGQWKWDSSGDMISLPGQTGFHDWYPPNQPDNGNGGQDCMVLFGNGNYTWNDMKCDYTRNFICEKGIII